MGRFVASLACIVCLGCGGVTVGVSPNEAQHGPPPSAAEPPEASNDPVPEVTPQVEVALEEQPER